MRTEKRRRGTSYSTKKCARVRSLFFDAVFVSLFYATSRLNVRFVLSEMAASHASRRNTHSAITTTSTIITA